MAASVQQVVKFQDPGLREWLRPELLDLLGGQNGGPRDVRGGQVGPNGTYKTVRKGHTDGSEESGGNEDLDEVHGTPRGNWNAGAYSYVTH